MDTTNRRGIESLIFIDGGDPQETKEAKNLLGFIDGQTTNPTLISKNPDIKKYIASGKRFSERELLAEYKRVVQEVAKITTGPTSIETHARADTPAENLLAQAREMFSWIPNAYIKFPTIPAGLVAAKAAVAEGIRVNMTLLFSQDQAAAVYSATRAAVSQNLPPYYEGSSPVYVSPFIGRLDDRGENGMDVIVNILEMYRRFGDGHVHILTASVRNIDHLFYALKLKSEIITIPFKVFRSWSEMGFALPDKNYIYDPNIEREKPLTDIPYKELSLDLEWQEYNLEHELTDIGLVKFAEDWENLMTASSL